MTSPHTLDYADPTVAWRGIAVRRTPTHLRIDVPPQDLISILRRKWFGPGRRPLRRRKKSRLSRWRSLDGNNDARGRLLSTTVFVSARRFSIYRVYSRAGTVGLTVGRQLLLEVRPNRYWRGLYFRVANVVNCDLCVGLPKTVVDFLGTEIEPYTDLPTEPTPVNPLHGAWINFTY